MRTEVHSPMHLYFQRTQPTHAATLQDIDDSISGRIKAPVRVVSTTNLAGTYNDTDMTLTLGAAGELVVDSVTLAVGNRLLLTAQLDATQNGIYVVTFAGDVTNPAILTRATDFDEDAEILEGVRINVDAGALFADSTWKLATTGIIVIDTTALAFIMTSQSQGTAKFVATVLGTGVATELNIQHELGTPDLSVTVRNITTNALVITDWEVVDNDNIKLLFAIPPDNTMNFRVVVIG